MASSPITSWQIDGETIKTVGDFILEGSKITADGDCNHEIKRHLLLARKAITKQHIKKQRHSFANKVLSSQSYVFSSSHVRMWELDYKESQELKNWCFSTVVLEKMLESPLDCKEIQPVNLKGNQSWIVISVSAETEAFSDESWNFNTLATRCEELTHWKRPWWCERLKAEGEGDDRGWDGWMASPWLNGHEFE